MPKTIQRFTPQEYYDLERTAEYKSDYYNGEIFAMGGGTSRHSLIVMNIGGALWQRLRGKPCVAYESNLRLKVKATGLRTYPDVSVYCGPLERDVEDRDGETVTNPTALFEVLSPTTEAYDRGFKSENYRLIESLKVHVLVSQEKSHVEVFQRQADGSWRFSEVRDVNDVLPLSPIGVDLPLAEIYDRIKFGAVGAVEGADS